MTSLRIIKFSILLAIIAILLAIMALSMSFTDTYADLFDPSMTITWCGSPGYPTCEPTAQGTIVQDHWATLSAIPPQPPPRSESTPTPRSLWELFFPFLSGR